LELETRVVAEVGRAEAVAAEVVARFGRFDVALARAVADAGALRLIAMPLLREGGLLISSGPPVSAKAHGPDVRIVEVPHLGLKRGFFVTKRMA
jgi:16S rRNA G527 N7-methylase RsmG